MTQRAIRAPAMTFHGDPFLVPAGEALRHWPDALMRIEDGRIASIEDAEEGLKRLPAGVPVTHYEDALICPGFIDAHVHYPQTQMIGAFGAELLEWLERYTFVAEQDFADAGHARDVAARFLRELLRAGTTTASVYCTVHPQSVDALFEESERFNTRMIAGKVLMDRNAPNALLDTAERGYAESKALIGKWHGRGRQLYCITPRFAPSSSEEQLQAAGKLWREHPGTYMQTHLCENQGEIEWVRQLFPERSSYLDVYDHAGLTGPRAIFGHAVHMDEEDFACCHRTGSALAHCPTSNLFLGSGLFRMVDAKRIERPVRVGLGTDIGAGTSFSQLQSLGEAYKVAKLGGHALTPEQGFYLATRGGAEALRLDDRIGSLAPGFEADFVVLDLKATPLLDFRLSHARDLAETLFVLMTLGDDRAIRATYVAGECVYERDRPESFLYPGAASSA
ncbi:guanine deaminase [Kaistia nematophila]|uniref:Guanine deaminase n=1 Tax=Kaistia nematophila TaxID=2994654 RepID=A0A9X3IKM3_9HYPH|nr:guanine deaminase [Kaistia nematophila]MCX5569764.1 guanine deaminase [Kaistia nematophila]